MSDIVPAVIAQFYLVTVIIVLLNLTINFKTKISSHMLALGGFVGYAFVFHSLMNVAGFVPILVFVLVSAITAAARLKLNAHTPTQIYIGFFVGLLTGLAAYLLF
jgi:membrane-associated phospholipid phosphatase